MKPIKPLDEYPDWFVPLNENAWKTFGPSCFYACQERWDVAGKAIFTIYKPSLIGRRAEASIFPAKDFNKWDVRLCKTFMQAARYFYPDLIAAVPNGAETELKFARFFGFTEPLFEEVRFGVPVTVYGAN